MRYINDNTSALFTQAFGPLPALPSAPVGDLVNNFSSNVVTIIDSITAIKISFVTKGKVTLETCHIG